MLELISITPDPEFARRLWALPGHTVMVDLEVIGKPERQAARDTVINVHSMADVEGLCRVPERGSLMVRIESVQSGGLTQLPYLCALGIDRIMLPMFRDRKAVDETVEALERWSGGSVRLSLLAETVAAVEGLAGILEGQPEWLDHVHIGLNDLGLERRSTFLFEPVATGEIARLAEVVRGAGRRFGFGGVGLPGVENATVPAEWILGEHVRVGSTFVILSRSFHGALGSDDPHALEEGVERVRKWETRWREVSPDEARMAHDKISSAILDIVKDNN